LGGGTAAAKPLDASINPAQAARAYALASGGRDATLPLPPASADAGTEQALDLIAGRPADAARRPDDAAAFAWPTADGRPGNADANEAASDASFTAGAAQAAAAQLGERTPEGFVARVWHHAQKAARELGVDPRALVAQAALETGWGRRGIARGDGGDSHNLFGIKAAGWNGERAVAGTHEYVDGVRRGETATFRAYRSVEESFSDYVRLLKNDGRYRQALRAGADIHGFARGLQQAGYATDPGYAAKIAAIATGPTIGRAVSAIGDAAARLARSFAGNTGGIAQR
jgi:flagellar protein FlgJ